MSNEQNTTPNWSGFSKEAENVLGEHFWKDFHNIMPKKMPPIDIIETESTGYILIELPGITAQEQVKMSFHGQNLLVEGEVPLLFADQEYKQVHTERFSGAFSRSIIIPFSFSPNQVSATYEQGIFILKIPKTTTHYDVKLHFSKK